MSSKDPNRVAAIEQAIGKKYGDEAIQNPRANWREEKEKQYLEQMSEIDNKVRHNEDSGEKIDINGIKVSKKLFNRESMSHCPVCRNVPKKTFDDVCLIKFDCCGQCYIKYVEGREERWSKGWRPNN